MSELSAARRQQPRGGATGMEVWTEEERPGALNLAPPCNPGTHPRQGGRAWRRPSPRLSALSRAIDPKPKGLEPDQTSQTTPGRAAGVEETETEEERREIRHFLDLVCATPCMRYTRLY